MDATPSTTLLDLCATALSVLSLDDGGGRGDYRELSERVSNSVLSALHRTSSSAPLTERRSRQNSLQPSTSSGRGHYEDASSFHSVPAYPRALHRESGSYHAPPPYIPAFSSQALGSAWRLVLSGPARGALPKLAADQISENVAMQLERQISETDRDPALKRRPTLLPSPSVALGLYPSSCPHSLLIYAEAWEALPPPPALPAASPPSSLASSLSQAVSYLTQVGGSATPRASLAGSASALSSRNSSLHGGSLNGSLHGSHYGLPPPSVPGPRGLPIELSPGDLASCIPLLAPNPRTSSSFGFEAGPLNCDSEADGLRVERGEIVGGMYGVSIAQVLPLPLATGPEGGGTLELVIRIPGGFAGSVQRDLRPVLWYSSDPGEARRPKVVRWLSGGWGLPRVTLEVEPEPSLTKPCVARLALEEWGADGSSLISISNVISVPVLPSPLVQELQHFNHLTGLDDASILSDLTALLSMASEASNARRSPSLPPSFSEAARRMHSYAKRSGRVHLAVVTQALYDGRRISHSVASRPSRAATPVQFAVARSPPPAVLTLTSTPQRQGWALGSNSNAGSPLALVEPTPFEPSLEKTQRRSANFRELSLNGGYA